MLENIKLFANHSAYDSVKNNLDKPNVSLCEQENEIHYNPYIPPPKNDVIKYLAPGKLAETTSNTTSGLHTNSFNGANGQLTIVSHTFENGVGTIEFDGDITSVGNYAFYKCADLTSINIPNTVTKIGERAF